MIYNLALVPPAGLSQDVHEKDRDMHHSVVTIKEAVFSDICTYGPPGKDFECT